jgi:hypothetical protein
MRINVLCPISRWVQKITVLGQAQFLLFRNACQVNFFWLLKWVNICEISGCHSGYTRFKSHNLWHCVIGWVAHDISKNSGALTFRVKTAWPWRLWHYDPLQCREPLTTHYSITSLYITNPVLPDEMKSPDTAIRDTVIQSICERTAPLCLEPVPPQLNIWDHHTLY